MQKTIMKLMPTRILEKAKRFEDIQRENLFANIFNSSINCCEWLKSKNFSPSGAAANYSLLYILFRTLEEVKPTCILEFGMGQTSKLTSQYANYKNPNANLQIVEDDQTWIDLFIDKIPTKNTEILKIDKVTKIFKKHKTIVYSEKLKSFTGNLKYDLILLDGPNGSKNYSRVHILDIIPKNLAESFVIIIDDYDRLGEQQTADLLIKKLQNSGINYDTGFYKGVKHQLLICSKNYSFLKSL